MHHWRKRKTIKHRRSLLSSDIRRRRKTEQQQWWNERQILTVGASRKAFIPIRRPDRRLELVDLFERKPSWLYHWPGSSPLFPSKTSQMSRFIRHLYHLPSLHSEQRPCRPSWSCCLPWLWCLKLDLASVHLKTRRSCAKRASNGSSNLPIWLALLLSALGWTLWSFIAALSFTFIDRNWPLTWKNTSRSPVVGIKSLMAKTTMWSVLPCSISTLKSDPLTKLVLIICCSLLDDFVQFWSDEKDSGRVEVYWTMVFLESDVFF